MSTRRVPHLLLAVLFLCWPLSHALAQNENETVGFRSAHIFDVSNFGDNIDILNGGLTVMTPIGQKYQVNQNLGYQLNLAYNSRVWNYSEDMNNPGMMRRGPMGLGHLLNFGRIYHDAVLGQRQVSQSSITYEWQCTWYYVSPDGAEHEIAGSNSPFSGATCGNYPGDSGAAFTTDGTFYKVGYASGTLNPSVPGAWNGDPSSLAAPVLVVTTPDGIRYTFGKIIQVWGANSTPFEAAMAQGSSSVVYRRFNKDFGGWYVTKIEDTHSYNSGTSSAPIYASWVSISYDPTPGFDHVIKTITDSAGRTITFTNECMTDAGIASTSNCSANSLIKSDNFGTAYGGNFPQRVSVRTKSIALPAFANKVTTDATVSATYTFAYSWQAATLGGTTETTNLLTSVTYPAFCTHASCPAPQYPPLVLSYNNGAGELTGRAFPTGGGVGYIYDVYSYSGGGLFGYAESARTRVVTERDLYLVSTGSPSARWTYTRPPSGAYSNPSQVTVSDPMGNDTVYTFHYSKTSQLGFTYCQDDGFTPDWNDGLLYKTEFYKGTGTTRTLVRTETRDYDADVAWCGQRAKQNIRTSRITTVYNDDGGRESSLTNSDWDNIYGHWRQVTESGSDVPGSRITRTIYVQYDPTRFSVREVSDGVSVVSRIDQVYDGSNNLTTSIARLVPPATLGTALDQNPRTGDVVTSLQYDDNGDGNIKEKDVYTAP